MVRAMSAPEEIWCRVNAWNSVTESDDKACTPSPVGFSTMTGGGSAACMTLNCLSRTGEIRSCSSAAPVSAADPALVGRRHQLLHRTVAFLQPVALGIGHGVEGGADAKL